ncbi:MAG: hypothetical protein ACP5VR_06305 [Acidimicrobiales bacterium]
MPTSKSLSVLRPPGDVVRLTGHAPLAAIEPPAGPILGGVVGYKGGPTSGAATLSEQALPVGGLTAELRAGNAKLRLVPAPSFASLGRVAVSAQYQAPQSPLSASPATPPSFAWCTLGYVQTEGPSGASKVPPAGASKLIGSDKAFAGVARGFFATCASAAVEGGAVFAACSYASAKAPSAGGAVGAYTTDDGASWSFVPVPAGSSISLFGGFRYAPSGGRRRFLAERARGLARLVPCRRSSDMSLPRADGKERLFLALGWALCHLGASAVGHRAVA